MTSYDYANIASAMIILTHLRDLIEDIPKRIDNSAASFAEIISQTNRWLEGLKCSLGAIKKYLNRAVVNLDNPPENVLKLISDNMEISNYFKLGPHFSKALINDILDDTSTFTFSPENLAISVESTIIGESKSVGYVIENNQEVSIHPFRDLANHLYLYLSVLDRCVLMHFGTLGFDLNRIDATIKEYES